MYTVLQFETAIGSSCLQHIHSFMRKAISVTRRKASGKLQIHCYYELTLKGRPFKRSKLQFNGPAKKYFRQPELSG